MQISVKKFRLLLIGHHIVRIRLFQSSAQLAGIKRTVHGRHKFFNLPRKIIGRTPHLNTHVNSLVKQAVKKIFNRDKFVIGIIFVDDFKLLFNITVLQGQIKGGGKYEDLTDYLIRF